MLELEEAVARIVAAINPMDVESAPITSAAGQFLSEGIVSPIDLPPFDNSAMDGYAVRAADVKGAGADSPIQLRKLGTVPAGKVADTEVLSGTCLRIFTGSPLPAGADAVVMQEDTTIDSAEPDRVSINDEAKPWENVRFKGEDIKQGEHILAAGEALSAASLSLLAACGIGTVSVRRRPLIGILATGSELQSPGEPLRPGGIYESNRLGVAVMAQTAGAIAKMYPVVGDHRERTRAALELAFRECDAVISSGGVSVGEFDFVKAAFQDLGGKLEFWKVAIKPGKPFVFGDLKGKPFFGLAGNPVSALVTCFLLIRPAIRKMLGARVLGPLEHEVRVIEEVKNPGDRRHFVRAIVDEKGSAMPTGIQASHILSSLAAANALLDLPPRTIIPAGSICRVLRWDQ